MTDKLCGKRKKMDIDEDNEIIINDNPKNTTDIQFSNLCINMEKLYEGIKQKGLFVPTVGSNV
jgi:hypothetical protein